MVTTSFTFNSEIIRDGEVLIIVPPFFRIDSPSLAAHVLQACARKAGFRVSILYANMLLAATVGIETYTDIYHAPPSALLGERFFARSAHDLKPLGGDEDVASLTLIWDEETAQRISDSFPAPEPIFPTLSKLSQLFRDLRMVEPIAVLWADQLAATLAGRGFTIVGCTTTFEQTNASIALLKRIKDAVPELITIIGGANCEGEMAEGIASLESRIDYVFSGESEQTFVDFLRNFVDGVLPAQRIIYGQPCRKLDEIPVPDFTEYFYQRDAFLPDAGIYFQTTWLPYETSRGCWWGQKHHCTFCGLNGEGIGFRQKSPEKVLDDLKMLCQSYPTKHIFMVDNIMPYTYFQTLIPRLPNEVPSLNIFYEQKANLTLRQVMGLKKAGVYSIQPGIEALSSAMLQLMKKGVNARQNLALLRYARAVGLNLQWGLLWGFPSDDQQMYEQTVALIPLLHHLEPPVGVFHLSIERFSPYFDYPEEFGVWDIKPVRAYSAVLPASVDPYKVAYHFTAHYDSAAHSYPGLIWRVMENVDAWRKDWRFSHYRSVGTTSVMLQVNRLFGDYFLLIDTRGLPGTPEHQVISRRQAAVALTARSYEATSDIEWALANKLGVVVDNWYVPLATAEPELILEFEDELSSSRTSRELVMLPE